jgi:hypothetical protein
MTIRKAAREAFRKVFKNWIEKKHRSYPEERELGEVSYANEDVATLLSGGRDEMDSSKGASHVEEVDLKDNLVESLQLPEEVFTPFQVPHGRLR